MPSRRWTRALRSQTRTNVALNVALRLVALIGLAGLWRHEAPDPGPGSLLAGATVGVLIAGLNLGLARSERFMRVWRERPFSLRLVVAAVAATSFVLAVEHAFGPTVVATAVVLSSSLGYHAILLVTTEV